MNKEPKLSEKFWEKYKAPQDIYLDGDCLHLEDKANYDKLVALEAKISLLEEFKDLHSTLELILTGQKNRYNQLGKELKLIQ